MKNEVKQSISSKSPVISKMSMKKERLPRKGSLANFKGWKPLYQDLKKRTRKNRYWIREWEERPKSWLRRIRHWEKRLKSREEYKNSLRDSDSFSMKKGNFLEAQGNEKGHLYIPYYHRRKFYKRPQDPISLGYHEKCFNRGLRRLRKYNKIPYWLRTKKVDSLNKMGVLPTLVDNKRTLSKKDMVFETGKSVDIFNHIRRYSRISVKSKRQGNKSNYYKLRRQRKETSFLRRGVPKNRIGIVHINAGLKNTIISLTDLNKDVKAWVSNGSVGFKRKKRKSPYASFVAGQNIGYRAIDLGYRGVIIHLKGVGRGRHNSCRGLAGTRLKILRIKDQIRLPHNGCRLRKKRRV